MTRYPISGSSPLARGLHGDISGAINTIRIIPARAGFTRREPDRIRCAQDHPRSRGVYYHEIAHETADQGSSPLARGLLPPPMRREAGFRIIPARAGFTASVSVSGSRPRDHPRSRGVYKSSGMRVPRRRGSSPLARGLRRPDGGRRRRRRIIPARAGFTCVRARSESQSWDHPRSRGVYLTRTDGYTYLERIIPARAGFTTDKSVAVCGQ